jgi:DNA-binding MarR family transcriptional regulator
MNPGQLYAQLWRLFRSIMADTQPELERSKLSLRSFFLLNKVDELPYPAQLAEYLLLPAPTISGLIKELEEFAYIQRETDKHDLRRFRITLTPKGSEVLQNVRLVIDRIMEERCGKLAEKEVEDLGRLLSVLEHE